MDKFDIVGAFRESATLKGWKFAFSLSEFDKNYRAQTEYIDGDLIFICDFKAIPNYSGALVDNVNYTCLMMLGRKFDPDTVDVDNPDVSNLDETDEQKYDRRLKDLFKELSEFIAQFACDNKLSDVRAGTISPSVNLFDTNIDFMIADTVNFTETI